MRKIELAPGAELAMLRLAQGDAYCAATEYIKHPRDDDVKVKALMFERYVKHPTHSLRAGQYTDDTQMSIAVAESIISFSSPGRQEFADSFVRCFHRDPRDGYARRFQSFLEETKTGTEFLAKINPTSDKNGAAMRSVPLGFLSTPDKVKELACLQAKLTHDTEDGIYSSVVVGLFSFYGLRGFPPSDWAKMLKTDGVDSSRLTGSWNDRIHSGKCSVAIATVDAAYTALLNNKTIKSVLSQVIMWGGDTDSVASIALGAGSCYLVDDMDEFFEPCLEAGGLYGVCFLKNMGMKLTQICDKVT